MKYVPACHPFVSLRTASDEQSEEESVERGKNESWHEESVDFVYHGVSAIWVW